jgi:sialate O-acetylesterase
MKQFLILALLTLLVFSQTQAKIQLAPLIGSNMVLQRNTTVNFWGEATANEKITVRTSWDQKVRQTRADKDGQWLTSIPTPEAGGPHTVTITGENRIVLENILIGEVWIASGQSNMEMPVTGFMGQPVEGAVQALTEAMQYPDIRMFTVPRNPSAIPQTTCKGEWKCSNPQNVGQFSATAYFFAKQLNRTLNVPVGIITSNWGGSAIEAWMPQKSMEEIPGLDMKAATSGKYDHTKPEQLYNGMIAPLVNYVAAGFIWYQGESNLHNYYDYDKLMVALVNQWRKDWKNQEMPFYYVELSPYHYDDARKIDLPLTIEAQYRALKQIPNVGIASTNDLGMSNCIHPAKKVEVGNRLAFLALEKTYGIEGLPAHAPTVKEVIFEQSTIILTFNHLPEENHFNDMNSLDYYNGKIAGFELAGKDRKFYPAEATHVWWKSRIELKSDKVTEPIAVRYAFRNFPQANVRTTAGLPLVPFRTDNWDDIW